ncbi:unnamed protein product, partial [Mesorhabditis belari]|uniref:Gustatory receptor n=1 Tax=Mesorhabditis belari TaxID=2138241 RepID=A0AAF3J4Y3_9BILA
MNPQILMFVNISVAHEDGIEEIVWIAYGMEMVFYLLSFATVPLLHHFLRNSKIFHVNLQLLFLVACYNVYPFTVARIGIIYYESQRDLQCGTYEPESNSCPIGLIVVSLLRVFVLSLVPVLLVAIFVERSVATVKVETYELHFYRPLAYLSALLSLCIAFFIATSFTFGIVSRTVADCLAISGTCMGGVFTLIVSQVNNEKLARIHNSCYTLSKRYQLGENVRTMQILTFITSFTILNNVFLVLLFYIHALEISWTIRNYIGIFLSLYMSIYYFFTTFIGLFANQQIYKLAKRMFIQKFVQLRDRSEKERENKQIFDTKGQMMYLGANQDDYFTQLESQWAACRTR